MSQTLHEQMLALKQLLIGERNYARDLDMQGLQKSLEDKAGMIARLKSFAVDALDCDTRQLIDQIRLEIRRNTRLYHCCMHTILGIWSTHCRNVGNQGYGPAGNSASNTPSRYLLSGKV